MSAILALVANALETAAGETTVANPSQAGYWRRIADASETLAGATNPTNDITSGYMLRAALALESIAGTSGVEESATPAGYLKRVVDALEALGTVGEGSLEYRMFLGAIGATFEEPAPAEKFPQPDLIGMGWSTAGGWTYDVVGGILNSAESGGQTWITSSHGALLRDALTPGSSYKVILSAPILSGLSVRLRGGGFVIFQNIDGVMTATVVCGNSTTAADAIILEDTEGVSGNITDISITEA